MSYSSVMLMLESQPLEGGYYTSVAKLMSEQFKSMRKKPRIRAERAEKPIPAVNEFVAHLQILELLDNAIFTAGYKAVLHIHSVVEECEIIELMQQIDPKTRKPMKKKVLFVKNGAAVVCRIQVSNMICIEKFSDFQQLGRFTLRTERKQLQLEKLQIFVHKQFWRNDAGKPGYCKRKLITVTVPDMF